MILFETNAAFQGIKELPSKHTRFAQELKGHHADGGQVGPRGAFSVAVENGAFRLKGNGRGRRARRTAPRTLEEMITFPYAERGHLVDAAATGWRVPAGPTGDKGVVRTRRVTWDRHV